MKITIIGAGPGGYETAVAAARKGVEVTLVSDGPLGGTCLNEGCIPTKVLCHEADILNTVSKASASGCYEISCRFDYPKIVERKEAVVAQLRSGVEFLLKHKLITLLYGHASLVDGHTVTVRLEDGTSRDVSSDYILIAAGSEAASLPIPGAGLAVTSREMLQFKELPRRLCVIGGGVIGLEFASIFRNFGSEVTVVEYCPNLLPRFDVELSKRLKQLLVRRGITVVTSAAVESIARVDDGLAVRYSQKGLPGTVTADKALMAVGRRPGLQSLHLSDAGIDHTPRGITVNEYMQTSLPSVYAAGDITGGMMLAHAATFEGLRALNHILAGQPSSGLVDSIRLDLVPAAVFTCPEAASAGLTEEECKERGLAFRCLKSLFRANGKALTMDEPEGFCKVIVSESGSRLLGCHLLGAHAADLIHEMAALLARDASLSDLQSLIHVHPTLSEVLQAASRS